MNKNDSRQNVLSEIENWYVDELKTDREIPRNEFTKRF